MRRPRSPAVAGPRVIGAVPLGVTKKVANEIVRGLNHQLSQDGRSVTVKAVRFIPSSRTTTETGSFQVVANAFFEVNRGKDIPPRSEALDSVVTVGRVGRAQKLESLSIPALRPAIA